jgi:3-deoxy-D-manno-octulosonate 8-phosphate phosphatase (KDO 8-P phosphatase)
VLTRVGLSTAPADAIDEVRSRVHWVSRHAGGRGAVRELVELLLRAQGLWDGLVDSYLT